MRLETSIVSTATPTKHQQAEIMAVKLQWRAALRSLELAVHMAERAGPDGIEAELRQLAELGGQAARLSVRNPVETRA
jgi:hypothetical protein